VIKEIRFPLPTIFDFLKKSKKKVASCHIGFERDSSLVEEFAEKANIDEALAKDILIVFFDEIKSNLLNAKIISINGYGKFYVGSGNRDKFQHVKNFIDVKTNYLRPKFMTAKSLRKKLRNMYG